MAACRRSGEDGMKRQSDPRMVIVYVLASPLVLAAIVGMVWLVWLR